MGHSFRRKSSKLFHVSTASFTKPAVRQSSMETERIMRTVKDLLRKATGPFLALLTYRNMPRVSGSAQLLMRKTLRRRVPITPERLSPDWPQIRGLDETDQAIRNRRAHDFNNRRRAEDLRLFLDGEEVWVTNVRSTETVLSPVQRSSSYVDKTPTGVIVRNRKHLVPNGTRLHVNEPVPAAEPATGATNNSLKAQASSLLSRMVGEKKPATTNCDMFW